RSCEEEGTRNSNGIVSCGQSISHEQISSRYFRTFLPATYQLSVSSNSPNELRANSRYFAASFTKSRTNVEACSTKSCRGKAAPLPLFLTAVAIPPTSLVNTGTPQEFASAITTGRQSALDGSTRK